MRPMLKKGLVRKLKVDKNWYHFKPFKNVFKNKKGQSTMIEYTTFIVCLILALIAMQAYMKRGIQGSLRSSADGIGPQYEPTNTVSDFTVTSRSSITSTSTVEEVGAGDNKKLNATTIVNTVYDEQTRIGTETVGAF